MLGNHNLAAGFGLSTVGIGWSDLYKDVGGLLAYQNLTHRWDWAVSASQEPYVAGGILEGIVDSGGQSYVVQQRIIQRQIYRGVDLIAARPLSRTRRLEATAGYQHVSFEEHVQTLFGSLTTGDVTIGDWEHITLAQPLSLVQAGGAFVGDRALFGATGPVAGERVRLQATRTAGTIGFATALADYRRYFMPVRFYTVAGRLLHYGRYGSGSEDARLLPLFLGYPELLRGYDINTFDDRLLGSRLLVANLELRFPLLRPFGISNAMYGPLPIEAALFGDAGTAWTQGQRPTFAGGTRAPVASAGVAFRVNLLGAAVAQISIAHPFQRPDRRLVWQFSLAPSF
jgi:hypothetical protein